MNLKHKLIPFYEVTKTATSRKKLTLSSKVPNVILFLAPDYGNIGDQMIQSAEVDFIKEIYEDKVNVIQIRVSETYTYLKSIRKQLKETDVICLVGGGSFGDLYPKAYFGRNFLVKYFNNHKIVQFPQSLIFTDTDYGRALLNKSISILGEHKDLTMSGRESKSYSEMKALFKKNNVLNNPDIVFFYKGKIDKYFNLDVNEKKYDVMFTIREDDEKKISNDKIASLKELVRSEGLSTIDKDSTINAEIYRYENNDFYMREHMKMASESKVIVTDRLHGMIFAYLVGTPCVVLPNTNHKISGTFDDWLSRSTNIKFVDDFDVHQVKLLIDSLTGVTDTSNIEFDYSSLENAIKNK